MTVTAPTLRHFEALKKITLSLFQYLRTAAAVPLQHLSVEFNVYVCVYIKACISAELVVPSVLLLLIDRPKLYLFYR